MAAKVVSRVWLCKFLTISFLAFLPSSSIAQEKDPTGQIVGIVVNHVTQEPLPFANVTILKSTLGTTTADDGRFVLPSVPPGIYTVRVSLIGYSSYLRTDVVVRAGRAVSLTIELDEAPVQSEGVTVTESYFSRPGQEANSIHGLTTEEIRRAPGAAEDINRVIQSLPGITFANDQRNDIIVRGGSPTENLFLLDDIEVPNINHYATFGATGGGISMVDVKYIDAVDVYTVGFSPKYGDRLSSVMNISLRDGNLDRLHGTVEAGLAGFGIAGEGPVSDRGSWILSARKSYLDLVKEAVQLKSVPHYQDAFGKLQYGITPSTRLSFLGVGGLDEITTSTTEDEPLGFQGLTQENYQYTLGGSLRQLFGSLGFATFSISHSTNRYNTTLLNLTDRTTQFDYRNVSRERETAFKITGVASITPETQLELGGGIRFLDFEHGIFAKPETLRSVDTALVYILRLDYNLRDGSRKGFAYWNLSGSAGRLTMSAGLRYDQFVAITRSRTLSPRISARWRIDEVTWLNASGGIFHQFPSLSWISAREINRELRPMRAWHAIVGFERLLDPDTRLTVEGYAKIYDRYPVSRQNPTMVMIDAAAGFAENIADTLMDGGRAQSIGVDVFVQKKLSAHLYGVASYSLSETRVRALEGGWRPGAFDNRHVVTLSGGYLFDKHWQAGVKFRFATGRAYTPIDQDLSAFFNQSVFDFGRLYRERYPNYFRLDIRIDRRDQIGPLSIVSFVEFQNITDHQNVFARVWDQRTRSLRTLYQFAFLPLAGLRIEF